MLKQCRKCFNVASTEAKICPHCGAPDPANNLRTKKIVGIIAGLVFFYWLIEEARQVPQQPVVASGDEPVVAPVDLTLERETEERNRQEHLTAIERSRALTAARRAKKERNRQEPSTAPVDSAVDRKEIPMDFHSCIDQMEVMLASIGGGNRITVVDSSIMKWVKMPTYDGSVNVVCSEPDGKMVITRHEFK